MRDKARAERGEAFVAPSPDAGSTPAASTRLHFYGFPGETMKLSPFPLSQAASSWG